MIDTYTIMIIVFALGLGSIPLIKQIKLKDKKFLVAYYTDKEEFEKYIEQLKKDGYWIE